MQGTYFCIWSTVETLPICYFWESKEHPFPSQKGLRHLFPACFLDELYVVFSLSYTRWKAEEEKESR